MAKTSKKVLGLIALVFGIIILFNHDLLAILVAVYLIIVGIANLVS